jgi:hypothetical protein
MQLASSSTPTGRCDHVVTRGATGRRLRIVDESFLPSWPSIETSLDVVRYGLPQSGLPDEVNSWRTRNLRHLQRGWRRFAAARVFGVPTMFGAVFHTVIRGDGTIVPYGLASLRLVTTAGCNYLVDSLQGLVEPEDMKYHGWGTGSTAEASGDTALVTELTTQYATNSVRVTGSQTEGGTANVYRSVATLTPDSGGSIVLREHGLFSDPDVGQGTLLDRSVYGAITLDSAAGDSLQTTYDFTQVAGS